MSFEPRYQANYCEENIWHLNCEPELQAQERSIVFISNTGKCFAMWNQKTCEPDSPVMWDYHVVLVARGDSLQIWDLDSSLGNPVTAQEWLQKSFGPVEAMPDTFKPRFRVLDAETFLNEFSSDRSHMLIGENQYREPVPAWDPIGGDKPSNLHRFINMDFPFVGDVYDLDDFTIWLG